MVGFFDTKVSDNLARPKVSCRATRNNNNYRTTPRQEARGERREAPLSWSYSLASSSLLLVTKGLLVFRNEIVFLACWLCVIVAAKQGGIKLVPRCGGQIAARVILVRASGARLRALRVGRQNPSFARLVASKQFCLFFCVCVCVTCSNSSAQPAADCQSGKGE